MIAGVDGCKDKWIAAVEMIDGRTEIWEPQPFRDLLSKRDLELIVVDIPIGLPDIGRRCADDEARKMLKARACCVFSAPIRPILDCETWEEACRKRNSIEKKKISKQAFEILRKVREVDSLLQKTPANHVFEGHPEISFALMNGRTPLLKGKKSQDGKKLREELVCEHFPDALARMEEHRFHREDVLDAYALLWTARRIKQGTQEKFPKTEARDSVGLRMEIVA